MFNKCLTKSITTGTNDSINGGYKTLRHKLQIAGRNWYRPFCCYSFISAVFYLLFSCRCLRNRFWINSLHCEEPHVVIIYISTSRGFFFATWNLMMRTETVTETMTFDPAITQIIARERAIKLTGYSMPFIKGVSVKIVCVHASTESGLVRSKSYLVFKRM